MVDEVENGDTLPCRRFALPVALESGRGGSEKPKTKGEDATRSGLARALVQEGKRENGEYVLCRGFALSMALDLIGSWWSSEKPMARKEVVIRAGRRRKRRERTRWLSSLVV